MALDATQVVVASFGHIYLGGTEAATAPTTPDAAPAGLDEMGYASEDGVTLSKSVDTEDINAWQSAVPVRRIVTGSELTAGMTLIQTNAQTMGLYFGAEMDPVTGQLNIPSNPNLREYALYIHWVDGEKDFGLWCPRVVVSDYGDLTLARGDAAGFEVTFTALPPASGEDLAVVLSELGTGV